MHLALYRKYRPKKFEEMIGQPHVTTILPNQIMTGEISHSYLFTGTRGTGKTSAAKIFAAAVNCLSPVKGSPCGECAVCRTEFNPDIIEIDAASNNKVDEIRELREKVRYHPTMCKYKVYIIDEVHMLTDSAYNALLKTLEEPPSFVIFILATTEPNKLPATILSRCMRFDFRLVGAEQLARLVEKIYKDIGKKATKEAVSLIARLGEGSVRDTLSVADLCAAYEKELTYNDVLTLTGASDSGRVLGFCRSVLTGDVKAALALIAELADSGKSMSALAKEITACLRDLSVVSVTMDASSALSVPGERAGELLELARECGTVKIAACAEVFASLDQSLKNNNPRTVIETAAVRAAIEPDRIARMEAEIAELKKKLS